jgi:hypothetical protein
MAGRGAGGNPKDRVRKDRSVPAVPLEKLCKRCGVIRSKTDFGRLRRSPDGLRKECNTCRTTYRRSKGDKPRRKFFTDTIAKVCNACGMIKTLSFYYTNQATKDKKTSICIECETRRKKQKTIFNGKKTINQHGCKIDKRICTGCGNAKQLDEYPIARQCSDGRASECKSCKNMKAAIKDLLNPEPTEHQEAIGFITWFYNKFPDILIYHIPNGMKRDIRSARILKSEGVRAGMPDYHIPQWNLWVELKRQTKGVLSQPQKKIIAHLESIGHGVIIGKGAEDASRQVLMHLENMAADIEGSRQPPSATKQGGAPR